MTAAALAASALLAGPGRAGEEAPLPVVEIAGRQDNVAGVADAASQGTAGAEQIRARPALRSGELLELVPGMLVTQHSGEGKANQYFLRGFNLDHGTDFATWVDGMPVNMRSHAHGQGYSDLNFVLPELVQRIDYKKGPYFPGEGDFASAGAAHLRLADSLPAGIASLSLGRQGYRRGVLADSIAAGSGILLYGLEGAWNDGPWRTPEAMRKRSGMLRYRQGEAGDGFSITAMAYRNRWNASDQVPLDAVLSGQLERYAAVDASDGGESARYSLSYALRRHNAGGLFELDLYAVQSSLDLFSNFTYFLEDPVHGDQFMQSERRRMTGANVAQSWSGELAGFGFHNKAGLQLRHDHISPVGLYAAAARQQGAAVREDRVDETSAGLYLESAVQWLPGWRTVAGARYDTYRFDVDSTLAGGNGNGNGSGKAGAHVVSPKLSMIFGPWRQTEYFINYGTGFHSNDARGVVQAPAAGSIPATPLVASRGGEFGVRGEALPGWHSSLALWRLEIDSELVFVGDAGDTAPSRASRRRGIEWSNRYRAAPWLSFELDLAASRARYAGQEAGGNFIPGALERAISFGVNVSDIGRCSGAFDLRYMGARPLVEDNSVRSRASVLGAARASCLVGRATSLAIDVSNVFDRRASDIEYFYRSRLADGPAGGVEGIHFHPVEPRAIRLTLQHKF
ncbi:MAG: TonB-dependent receptor [Pseudomonadota bacterium]